jgi:hypothetical protein
MKPWESVTARNSILDELANEGLLLGPLAEEVGRDLDPFDLICYVAFDQPSTSTMMFSGSGRDLMSVWNPSMVISVIFFFLFDTPFSKINDIGLFPIGGMNSWRAARVKQTLITERMDAFVLAASFRPLIHLSTVNGLTYLKGVRPNCASMQFLSK